MQSASLLVNQDSPNQESSQQTASNEPVEVADTNAPGINELPDANTELTSSYVQNEPAVAPLSIEDLPPFPESDIPGTDNNQLKRAETLSKINLATANEIPLSPGWNLISIPQEQTNTDPAAVLASIAGSYTRVYAYDNCDTVDPWKLYDPNDLAGSDLTAIDNTMGLWVEMSAAASLTLTGSVPASTDIPICTGWNLIGYPVDQELLVAGALSSIDGLYDRLFGYEVTDVDDFWEVHSVGFPDYANDLQMMKPTRGYWVRATQDSTVTITGPPSPLEVEIFTPDEDAEITYLFDVTGVVTSTAIADWQLDYRLKNESEWIKFQSGNTTVTNITEAQFDPTLLLNGIYEMRLSATNDFGQTASTMLNILVEGEAKVGLFSLSFLDMNVPVSGIPLSLIRTYDSRDKRVGDFGVGWTLDILNGTYTNNRKPGDGWDITRSEDIFFKFPCSNSNATKSHITNISLSELENYRFSFQIEMSGLGSVVQNGCIGTASFVQIDGIPGASLEVVGDSDVLWLNNSNEVLDFDTFEIYEPEVVRLTTPDGREIDISLLNGVEQIRDRNENELTIRKNSITHSSGKSVIFVRDDFDRITEIIDPAGKSIRYAYDVNGDLISITDQEGNTTTFTYDANHYLLDTINPLGIRAQRNEYDTNGRLIAVIDANGNQVSMTHDLNQRFSTLIDRTGSSYTVEYDTNGNVVREIDASGQEVQYAYDANGDRTSQIDALGNATSYAYDSSRNLTSITNPLGESLSYTYDSNGYPLSNTDSLGNLTTYTYDNHGNLIETVDGAGNIASFSYDVIGNLIAETDAQGCVTSYEYDASGNVIHIINALGFSTLYDYDANGNQTSSTITRTLSSGAIETLTTQFVYNTNNQPIQTVYADGTTTSIEYNANSQVVAEIDQLGRRVEYSYDVIGNLLRIDYPDGTYESFSYDAEGQKVSETDRAGRITQYAYDANGRLLQVIYPDGSLTSSTYDQLGRPVTLTDELGGVTTFEFDDAGRRTAIINALGFRTSFLYDSNGNQSAITDANGHTILFEYNANNLLTKEIYPDGKSSQFEYDSLNRLTSGIDQAGNTTNYEYDCLGRLISVTDAEGQTTSFAYDELGNLIAQTDAEGRTTTYGYDSRGFATSKTLPLGQTTNMTYDDIGNLVTVTDFNGKTTTYSYTLNNQIDSVTFPDGGVNSYTYTATGLPATITDSRGITTYSYDSRNRVIEIAHPDGQILGYQYDAFGNRTSLTSTLGTIQYSYDSLHRLIQVTDPDGGVTNYAYDSVGNRASMTYPNGSKTTYTYDTLNRLINLSNAKSDGTSISDYTYTLAPAGNRTQVQESSGRVVNYTYDNVYRLTQEVVTDPVLGNETFAYAYDNVGNRLTSTINGLVNTYSYDDNDRLISETGVTYAYDDNGNLLTKTLVTGESIEYSYDFQNRLIQALTINADSSTNTVRFEYDTLGNRVQSTVNDSQVTNYLVDTNMPYAQVMLEYDDVGNLLSSYIYGDDLISMKTNAATSYYLYDGQLSVRQLLNSSQQVTDEYNYDAFGNLTFSAGSTNNNYLYTGEQYDPNIGFYYLRARYFDPSMGRFLTADPFDGLKFEPVSLHKYLYVANNPVNLIDPSGEIIGLISGFQGLLGNLSTKGAQAGKASYITLKTRESIIMLAALTSLAQTFITPDQTNTGVKYDAKLNERFPPWPDIGVELNLKGQGDSSLIFRANWTTGKVRLKCTIVPFSCPNVSIGADYPLLEYKYGNLNVKVGIQFRLNIMHSPTQEQERNLDFIDVKFQFKFELTLKPFPSLVWRSRTISFQDIASLVN